MAETTSYGVRISYDDRGQGEPALIMLPGWCGSRRVFEPLLSRCGKRRRVLALDWRGHGESERVTSDFGIGHLVEDTLSVIEVSGATQVVPVALSHAGWVAIELRRRLGKRIAKLVLLDWIVTAGPPNMMQVLQGLQSPSEWERTRDALFEGWLNGVEVPALTRYVREDMGSYGFDMWARAGREIAAAYANYGSPMNIMAPLGESMPVLHLYAQPDDPAYLARQQAFSEKHPWFQVRKLVARSHFPMLEVPDEIAQAIEDFVG